MTLSTLIRYVCKYQKIIYIFLPSTSLWAVEAHEEKRENVLLINSMLWHTFHSIAMLVGVSTNLRSTMWWWFSSNLRSFFAFSRSSVWNCRNKVFFYYYSNVNGALLRDVNLRSSINLNMLYLLLFFYGNYAYLRNHCVFINELKSLKEWEMRPRLLWKYQKNLILLL